VAPPQAAPAKLEPIAPPQISSPPPQRAVKSAPAAQTPKAVAKTETPSTQPNTANALPKEVAPVAVPSEDNSIGRCATCAKYSAELPAIVVNGYIYAKTPSDRSVLTVTSVVGFEKISSAPSGRTGSLRKYNR